MVHGAASVYMPSDSIYPRSTEREEKFAGGQFIALLFPPEKKTLLAMLEFLYTHNDLYS